jgi:hypothetical protein
MMNISERYLKFLLWGFQTQFIDATWSPTGEYLAYTYFGPDGRTKLMIVQPPGKQEKEPKSLNTWFDNLDSGEVFQPIGWVHPSDTVFSFAIVDSSGKTLETHDLQLHFDPEHIPEHMKEARQKKPAGVIKPKIK